MFGLRRPRVLKRLAYWSAALVLLSQIISAGLAKSVLDGVTPASLTPGSPDGTYSLSNLDSVNLFNGHMNFALPIFAVRGRGSAAYTMMLPIDVRWATKEEVFCDDAGGCVTRYFPFISPTLSAGFGPGKLTGHRDEIHEWNGGNFGVAVQSLTILKFTLPGGTEYQLRDTASDGKPFKGFFNVPSNSAQLGHSRGTEFKTFDGTNIIFRSDGEIRDFFPSQLSPDSKPIFDPTGLLLMPDGTRYRIDNGNVTWIRDRHGNQLTFSYRTNGFTVTDSLQREVAVDYNVKDVAPFGLCHRIAYTGFSSAESVTTEGAAAAAASAASTRTPKIIRVSIRPMAERMRNSGAEQSSSYSLTGESLLFPDLDGGGVIYNPNVASTVWLPDGQKFDFYYNNYAELARVELPTGGAYEYDFSGGVEGGSASGVVSLSDRQIYRRITERRVYVNRTKLESKTVYLKPDVSASALGSQGPSEVVTLDRAGKPVSRSLHYFNGNVLEGLRTHTVWENTRYPGWRDGREYKSETYGAGTGLLTRGPLLRVTENEWKQRAPVLWWTFSQDSAPPQDTRLAETKTTLSDSGEVSKTVYKYSDDPTYNATTDNFNNLTDTLEYDFGTVNGNAGPLLRHTHTDYLKVNPTNNLDYTAQSIYMLRLPQFVKVKDGSGNPASQTEYVYDESAYPVLTYGSTIPGWSAPETPARGNVTTTRSWLDFPGEGMTGPEKWVGSHAQYDQAGNLRFAWDAVGNMSEVQYGAEYAYAFPTLTKTAKPDPTPTPGGERGSAVELTTQATYDLYTGALTSVRDANGKLTTPEYNEPLDRLSRVNRPAGTGWTQYDYGNTPNNLFRRERTAQDDTVTLESYQYFDGLGRPTRSMHYEGQTDACGTTWSVVDTQYDPLGRVASVSTPYRTCSLDGPFSPTGWTSTEYDSLGRTTIVKLPDGAKNVTAYKGSVTQVTDPSLNSKRSKTNALGRLTEVTEYNRQVADPTVVETPQSGDYLTKYSYNVLGNLVKAEQGVQTRTFVYDSLSRLRSFTSPEAGVTAYEYYDTGDLLKSKDARGVACTRTYDGLNRVTRLDYSDDTPDVTYTYDIGAVNGLGKMTKVASAASTSSYTTFDDAGRVTDSSQTTDGTPYGMHYEYDLAGHMTSQTYPSGRKVMTGYDAAGRIKGVSGVSTGESAKAYTSSHAYGAQGLIEKLKLGNGLWENTEYNNRLQPKQIKLSSDGTGLVLLQLDYGYGTTDNNGNVLTQTITVPATVNVPGFNATQSYTYDHLNRLKEAREVAADSTLTWKQNYSYDRYGNRRLDPSGTTTPAALTGLNNPTISESNNRIEAGQGYVYDDGAPNGTGNLTQMGAATHYTYDAENRISSYDKTDTPGTEALYAYDGNGNRVKKVAGGTATVYVYNAIGQLVAEYANAPQPGSGGTSYFTSDSIGSVRAVTDANGGVRERHDYYPFGEDIAASVGARSIQGQGYVFGTQDDKLNQKFTGKERDKETALDYFGARYYQPGVGRFVSADPAPPNFLNPQNLNRYQYALNNPLYYTDRDGRQESEESLVDWLMRVIYARALWKTGEGDGDDAPKTIAPGINKYETGEELAAKAFEQYAQGISVLNEAIVALDPTGGAAIVKAAIEADPLHPDLLAGAETAGIQVASGFVLSKGLRAARLFSGVSKRLGRVVQEALGPIEREVVVTEHTSSRYLERAIKKGGDLKGTTFEQVGSTLAHGEYYFDKKYNNYIAVRKGVAVAFDVDSRQIVVRTIEPGHHVRAGARFVPVRRPF